MDNPHDKFFRRMFGNVDVVRDFLQIFLSAEMLAKIDLTQLTPYKEGFVDERLREQFTDILYLLQQYDGEPLFSYFLFEHKSWPPPMVAYQLLQYKMQIWEHWLTQHEQNKKSNRLIPILPIVVYHGKRGWNVPPNFSGLYTHTDLLKPYLLDFQYLLVDLSNYHEEEERGTIHSQVVFAVLKYILNDHFPDKLEYIASLMGKLWQQPNGRSIVETVLRYITQVSSATNRTSMIKAITHTLPKGDEFVKTIADTWIEEGISIGEVKAIKNLLATLLLQRFGEQSALLMERINTIDNLALLNQLTPNLIWAATIEDAWTHFNDTMTRLGVE